MRYKITLIIICVLLLTGCGSKEEVLECKIGDTVITITVSDGKIINYNDKIKGELSNEEISTLNQSYLSNISNNADAVAKLREVIATNGGDCS